MKTTTRTRGQSVIYPLSALLFVLATLFHTFTPAHVTARSSIDDSSTVVFRALPAWWHVYAVSGSDRTAAIDATADDNEIEDVAASTTFGADAEVVGSWGANTYTSEPEDTWTVTGTYQGLIGTADVEVQAAELVRFEMAGYPASTVAGNSFENSIVITAYDGFDNVKTDYVGEVIFYSSDALATLPGSYVFQSADAGVHAFPGSEFTLFRAPTQTITVEDMTTSISETSGWIGVEPAEISSIRINSAAGNGGQAYGNPVEVGTHTMDIYETYTTWAGSYDEYNNYREDVEVNWTATGVLTHGVLTPNPGVSTTFTPAPVLSGIGTITAVHITSGQGYGTGLFTIEAPELIVSKSGDPDPVAAGGYLLYTLVYTNVGDAVAQGVRITETLDSNVSFVSAGPPPTIPPNVWTRATLGVGQSSEIYVTVLADGSIVPGTPVTNEVHIGGSRLEQYRFVETTVVTSTPDLSVTLNSAPDPVEPGSDLVYHFQYENQGNAPVHNTHIVMAYDENVTFRNSVPAPDGGTDDEWSIGDLQAGDGGSIRVTVAVDEYLLGTHTLITSATIESDETVPFSVYETTSVAIPPSSLQLSISNDEPSVKAGEFLVYELIYSNVGSGSAYSTTIIATPPLSELVNTTGCLPAAICEWNGEQSVYNIGTVPSGDNGNVYLVGRVRDPLPAGMHIITASATITTATPGDPPDGKYAQDVDEIATRPNLQITADYHDLSPYPGKRLTYTIRFSNTGHIATEGVIVTATRARYTTYHPDASSSWHPTGDRHFVYTVGAMSHNQSGELLFVVTVPTGTFTTAMPNFDTAFGIYDNGISGEDADPDDNIVLAPLGLPDLIVTGIEVNWESLKSDQPGNHVTVTIKNQGTGIACYNGVDEYGQDICWSFYIDLYINPAELPSSYPAGESFGDAYAYNVGPVDPGESKSYIIKKMVKSGTPFKLPDDVSPPLLLYARVDSVDVKNRPYGFVPEYNELNNLYRLLDPEYDNAVYLPVVEKEYRSAGVP
jgi:uncharacterized repeat protein (TIGR01451 family)